MNKINLYAILGIMFLSSTLLGNGMYSSNQIFAVENGTENEAEVKADIEQENKCKQDTECENKNKINNTLNITTITGAGGNGNGETPTDECIACFNDNLSPGIINNINSYLDATVTPVGNEEDVNNIDELCDAIANADPLVDAGDLVDLLHDAIPGEGQEEEDDITAIINCLIDLGLISNLG